MPTSFMGTGTKYLALEEFLMDKTENITLTFIEINEIIGEKLPVPSDSAVFKAGYKVEKIDFKTKSVIFSKGVRDWILNKEWFVTITKTYVQELADFCTSWPFYFFMNDKEKLKEILRMIDDLERYADSHNVRVNTFSTKELKKSLQKIRGVLEA